jgi:hypothetical protein
LPESSISSPLSSLSADCKQALVAISPSAPVALRLKCGVGF